MLWTLGIIPSLIWIIPLIWLMTVAAKSSNNKRRLDKLLDKFEELELQMKRLQNDRDVDMPSQTQQETAQPKEQLNPLDYMNPSFRPGGNSSPGSQGLNSSNQSYQTDQANQAGQVDQADQADQANQENRAESDFPVEVIAPASQSTDNASLDSQQPSSSNQTDQADQTSHQADQADQTQRDFPADAVAKMMSAKPMQAKVSANTVTKPIHTRKTRPTQKPTKQPVKKPTKQPAKQSVIGQVAKTFIKKALRFFIERWMVVLGVTFLVVGVGYLGTIAFLRFSPFFRFLTITGISAAFAAIYLIFRRRSLWWEHLGSLFLSASAAVFLYACVGASYITALKWIDSAAVATALIILGIAANFASAIPQKRPYIRSFHTFLALLSLTFAPPSLYLPLIASLTAIFAIVITAKLRYEWDILIITVAFSIYNMLWGGRSLSGPLPPGSELYGFLPNLLASSAVYFTALYKSYFRSLRQQQQDKRLLYTHLIYWVQLGLNLLIYLRFYAKIQTPIAVVSVGLVILFLSFRIRKQNDNWLFLIDALAGKALLITGLLLFPLPLFGETLLLFSACFLIAVLALALCYLFAFLKERYLYFVDAGILALASLAMFFSISPDIAIAAPQIYALLGLGVLSFGLSFIIRKWKIKPLLFTLVLISQAIILVGTYLLSYHSIIDDFLAYLLIAGLALAFCFLFAFFKERYLYFIDAGILALASLAMFFNISPDEAAPQIYTLLGFGVLSFGLSFIIRKWKIQQLFFTLVLIGQSIILVGVFLLSYHSIIDSFSAYLLIAALALAFCFLFAFFKERYLYFIDAGILALASFATFFSISSDISVAAPQIYTLFSFGVLSFALSYIIRKWKVKELFFILALISQTIALVAIFLLYYHQVIDNLFYNLTLIFLMSLIFSTLLHLINERKLYKITFIATVLIACVLLPVGIRLFNIQSLLDRMLFILLPLPIAAHYILQQYSSNQQLAAVGRIALFRDSGTVWYKNRVSLLCILAAFFPLGLYGILFQHSFFSAFQAISFQVEAVFYLCIVALGLGALVLKHFGKKASIRMDFQNISYLYNLAFFVSFALLILSYKTSALFSNTTALYLLSLIVLYFAAGLALPKVHDGKRRYQLHIYGLTAALMCMSYFSSPLATAAVWLFLSLVALELSRFFEARLKDQSKSDDPAFHLLECGLILIASGLLRLYLVVLQVEEYVGPFKLRWLYEVFAASTLFYWVICKNIFEHRRKNFAWQVKFLPEVLTLFVASIFIYELQGLAFLQPLVWILFAYLLMFAGLKKPSLRRLKFEGVLFFLISLGQTVFTTSTYYTPRMAWQYNPILWGIVLFFIAGGFVYLTYKNNIVIAYKKKIIPLKFRNFIYLYPIALAVGVFLYWNFSSQTLTLLWIIEFFFIFILCLLLRQQSFLHVSSAGILLCIVRLIFYDLQGESIPIRAFLFLSVGAILVGMHLIYKKFGGARVK